MWQPIRFHCLGRVPQAVIVTQNSPDTHTRIQTHMNALMQAGWLVINAGQHACLHAKVNTLKHTHIKCKFVLLIQEHFLTPPGALR